MSKKILITGGTGLIGKEALPYLLDGGYEIYAISTEKKTDSNIHWIQCDLCDLNLLKDVIESIKPEYLLHFAWITGGDYLTNEKNIALKDAGINLIKLFKENGGRRAVYAGTCFEYDINGEILNETSVINPKTLYAKCKNDLHKFCEEYSQSNGLSFGWGRIFYVYGNGEQHTRLTAGIINSLKEGREFVLNAPDNCLDYMYTKDIVRAFIAFMESSYEGSVNICSGNGVTLGDYALKIQSIMNKQNLIKFGIAKNKPLKVIGDNTVLKTKIGFNPKYTLDEGLKEVLSEI